jgi:hypothetical protein
MNLEKRRPVNIEWVGSPNFRKQIGVAKKFAVLHWMVGTLSGTDASFAKQSFKVATNYGIEDTQIHQYVADADYAFGSGTVPANSLGISIEHSGGDLVNGARRHPSPATHETSALLLAYLSRKHGWGHLSVGRNVFLHKDFVSTECPGSLDVRHIVERANTLLGNATLDAAYSTESDWREAQIVVDGVFGPQTVSKLQWVLGFRGPYIDGQFGPVTVKKCQSYLGQVADGHFGPVSTRALQRHLGVVVDGNWGSQTTTALQIHLNSGRF